MVVYTHCHLMVYIYRQDEIENVSPETQVPSVKKNKSRLVEQQQEKAKGEPEVTSPSSLDAETPKKASPNNSRRISVNLSQERLFVQAPESTTPVVEDEKTNHNEEMQTSDVSLRLEDSEDGGSDVEDELPRSRAKVKSNTVAEKSLSVKSIPVPTPRVTCTKQKALQCPKPPVMTDSEEEDPVSQPMAKPSSTQNKQVTTIQDALQSQITPPPVIPKTRVMLTKLKDKNLVGLSGAEVAGSQSQQEEVEVIEVPKNQRTHPEKMAEMDGVDAVSSNEEKDPPQNTRSTRTKKRMVEVTVVSSSTKRRKTDESSDHEVDFPVDKTNAASRKSNSPDTRKGRHGGSQDSASSSGVSSVKSNAYEASVGCFTKAPQPQQPAHRVTRSKVRQAIKKSPVKASPRTKSPKTPQTPELSCTGFTGRSPFK